MIKRILISLAGIAMSLSALAAKQANVLVIIVDDLGYGDLSCQGSTEILTPNIDRLADSGIRFTDGYVTSPQCGPSRAGLISGVMQDRFGYNDIINQNGLPPKSVLLTLPEQMKRAGYVTGMAGKWHVGYKNPEYVHPPEANNAPWLRGFDFVNIHDSGMSHFYNYSEIGAEWNLWRGIDNRYLRKRENEREPSHIESMDPDVYMTDYLTDEACAFINRHQKEPWFFYLSYNAPHTPMVAKKGKMAKYAHLTGTRRVLAAMMDSVDEGVGKVVSEIRATGQEANTMVWFLSDNGGETPHNGSVNGPLAGRKGHLFEGGIRVPFIVAFPGTLPAGQVESEPISSLDILPTSMALAGAYSIPEIYDGHNVLPWLQGQSDCPSKELFWSFWGNFALRMGDYKQVRSNRTDVKTVDGRAVPGHFASNIRENPGEDPDFPLESPERLKLLNERLDQRIAQLRADQKVLKPVYTSEFQQSVDARKIENTQLTLLDGQWVRIDFEQVDAEARIAGDRIMPPMTDGHYSEGCRVVDGVSGKGLRLKRGSMTIGKSPSTSEFKSTDPGLTYLWLRLEGRPDGTATVLDMTDNTRPIKKSSPGYRLQLNRERVLQLAIKTSDGQAHTHVFKDLGALPLNQWQFIALRFDDKHQTTLTVLSQSDLSQGASVVAASSESFQLSAKRAYTASMLPRGGANATGRGNFFEGSIDEIGFVRNGGADAAVFKVFRKTQE